MSKKKIALLTAEEMAAVEKFLAEIGLTPEWGAECDGSADCDWNSPGIMWESEMITEKELEATEQINNASYGFCVNSEIERLSITKHQIGSFEIYLIESGIRIVCEDLATALEKSKPIITLIKKWLDYSATL